MFNIEKPSEVLYEELDESRGKFTLSPLEPGYGTTIGNAYRRVLLSSIYGYAIVSISFPSGIPHEFSAIPGVLEDTVDLILNLKQVRFRPKNGLTIQDQKISINIKKSEVFLAGDIEKFTSDFEIANPDHIICNIAPDHSFAIDIVVSKGKGYVPASEMVDTNVEIGKIAIDAIYSPIKNVKFEVENTRVGNRTDYDRLVIDVTTDKTVSPENALKRASNILIDCFSLMLNGGIVREQEVYDLDFVTDDELSKRQILKKQLKDLKNDLSTRAINCLQGANINTVGELLERNLDEIEAIKSFGKKSLSEVTALMQKYNREIKG